MAKEGGKYQSLVKRQQGEKTDEDDNIMNIEQALEEEKKFIRMFIV